MNSTKQLSSSTTTTRNSSKLAFVRLNRNKNVYRRTNKQIIIDVDSDSDSPPTHQDENRHKNPEKEDQVQETTTNHQTPIHQTTTRTNHQRSAIISIHSSDHTPSIISIDSDDTQSNHSIIHHQQQHPKRKPYNNDSPLQFNRTRPSKPTANDQSTGSTAQQQQQQQPSQTIKPKPRHRAIFVRTIPHSPVVLIPRIPRKVASRKPALKQSPIQQKTQSPTIHPPSSPPPPSPLADVPTVQPPIAPAPRVVRGRISMVTGSARRSRFLDLLQSQKLPSSPQHAPQTPRQLAIPPSSHKLSNHSPLISHHPSNRIPYVNRPINDGIPSLLKICNQNHVLNFTTTVENIEKKAVSNRLSNLRTKTKGSWEKIGEATYSEVFCWSPKQLGNLSDSSRGDNDQKSLESKIVMKIIPIKRSKKSYLKTQTTTTTTTSVINVNGDESMSAEMGNQSLENEFPLETDCLDAEKEIKLAQLLGSKSSEGFIDFKGCFVVSGEYPRVLLSEWDKYRRKFPKQAENPRPGKFSVTQLYCCLLFAHAGKDLEASSLNGWQQAASILEQVARALNQVEDEYEFEHRDLHWGNLLIHSVKPPPSQQPARQANPIPNPKKSRVKISEEDVSELTKSMNGIGLDKSSTASTDPLRAEMSGVGVSIIDYGLSRAKIVHKKTGKNTCPTRIKRATGDHKDHEILWTDPDLDIFGASGSDYQFDCYDLINLTRENKPWSEFNPISNVIWLHYLTKKLLEEKSIARPASTPTTSTKEERRKTTATRVRRTTATANQKTKGKNGRNSSHPSNKAVEESEDESDHDPDEKEKKKRVEPKSRIEGECYQLLVASQRFLHDLIQLKVERIHQRSTRDPESQSKVDQESSLKTKTIGMDSVASSVNHSVVDHQGTENVALVRKLLDPSFPSRSVLNTNNPLKHPLLDEDRILMATIDQRSSLVNLTLSDRLDSFSLKKKKNQSKSAKMSSLTSLFLDWFLAYKTCALS